LILVFAFPLVTLAGCGGLTVPSIRVLSSRVACGWLCRKSSIRSPVAAMCRSRDLDQPTGSAERASHILSSADA
jgi:hypothetical protein